MTQLQSPHLHEWRPHPKCSVCTLILDEPGTVSLKETDSIVPLDALCLKSQCFSKVDLDLEPEHSWAFYVVLILPRDIASRFCDHFVCTSSYYDHSKTLACWRFFDRYRPSPNGGIRRRFVVPSVHIEVLFTWTESPPSYTMPLDAELTLVSSRKMLLLLLCCCLRASLDVVAGMPPPIRPIAEIGDAAQALLGHDVVPTELSLGRSWDATTHRDPRFWSANATPQPSLSESPRTFSHSDLSPFRSRQPSLLQPTTSSWIDSSSSAGLVDPSHVPLTQEQTTASGESNYLFSLRQDGEPSLAPADEDLDVRIGLTQDSRGYMHFRRLTTMAYYHPSRWFDSIYSKFLLDRKRRRPWSHDAKVTLPLNDMQVIVRNTQDMFRSTSLIYKLSFDAEDGHEAGDVLVRYFSAPVFVERVRIPGYTLGVWKTSNGGERLAFLGLYHCPRHFFDTLRQRPGTRVMWGTALAPSS